MLKLISNMSIRIKIYSVIILTVIGVIVIASISISLSSSVQNKMQTNLMGHGVTSQSAILNADRDLYQAYSAVQAVILNKSSQEEVDKSLAYFNENVQGAKERILEAKSAMEQSKEEWINFKGESSKKTAFELFDMLNYDIETWVQLSNKTIESKKIEAGWEESFQLARVHADEISGILEEAINTNSLTYLNINKSHTNNTIYMIIVFLALVFVYGYIINKNISKPLSSIVTMIKELEKGHLKTRLNIDRKDEIGVVAKSMDHFADDLQHVVVDSIKKVSDGDFNFNLTPKDDEDEIIPALKKTVESIKGLILEINTLTGAALDGELQTRGNTQNFNGAYKEIIFGINKTLDATLEPIKEASLVLGEMSKGNLHVSMNGDYKGEHSNIKNALNETIYSLKAYISDVTRVLTEMANGNLDITITNDYKGDFVDIKNSLNNILEEFSKVISDINNSAHQVSSGSRQISDSAQILSQNATEQASSIEELTTTMEIIAEKTKMNAVNANNANELALAAKSDAIGGNEQMKAMLKSMDDISEASTNISKIIKVIDEIAFQTNILALNAAVEAARAGQHGKGFAVVADEVRSLAGRSAQAAKETTNLIEGTVKITESGMIIAKETACALEKIVNGVTKATSLVGDIASASNDQATGISQVNQGISQISKVVQTYSATSEQSAASSEELSSQAEILSDMVSRFRIRKSVSHSPAFENIDPEIINHLERTSATKRINSKKDKLTKVNKKNILLSDTELGKY